MCIHQVVICLEFIQNIMSQYKTIVTFLRKGNLISNLLLEFQHIGHLEPQTTTVNITNMNKSKSNPLSVFPETERKKDQKISCPLMEIPATPAVCYLPALYLSLLFPTH